MKIDALYDIDGLSVDYASGRVVSARALEVASLALREGEPAALVGPNGSGKTTLLKVLNGLVRPHAGRILFRGEELGGAPRLRLETVYLHQSPYVMAGSVSYNVAFGARSRGAGRREAAGRAAEAMAVLGLEGFGGRGHRALSGGEAQRVGLARALATGASVFLLDEPTASVDALSRDLVIEVIRRLCAGGSTIIFSTHDPALAELLGARILRLEAGRVVDDRRPR